MRRTTWLVLASLFGGSMAILAWQEGSIASNDPAKIPIFRDNRIHLAPAPELERENVELIAAFRDLPEVEIEISSKEPQSKLFEHELGFRRLETRLPVAPAKPLGNLQVHDALGWLARHQKADGSWSSPGYTDRCSGSKCQRLIGNETFSLGVTGLATMAFVRAGVDYQTSDESAG
jgi:hypothetical protein